jgi:ABC-type multidrug transport system ATPase subunit
LKTIIEDNHKFTKTVLKKIALARCLTADADIYILDNPWGDMDEQYSNIVERRLRDLQDKKKTIIISLKFLENSNADDQIAIIH